ncbi:MAG: ABC transporter ATP-binding protein [Longimicrobiales bacterium]
MNTDDAVVVTRGLTKCYGDVTAVAGLDLEVRPGEVYGFLGRNGAGKTTTIRMLLGLIRPTAGEARLLGAKVGPNMPGLRRVGYLVETATAYGNLTVRENLELQRRLMGAPAGAVGEATEVMRIGRYADRRAGTLSLGNKQRLSLARALLHRPDVLVLDEPANGLDPAGIVEVRELLRRLADGGVTVFMSSHILTEVAQLADRIGLIHDGRLIEELDRDGLRRRARPYVEVQVDRPERARALLTEAGFTALEPAAEGIRVFDGDGRASEIARALVEAGLELRALVPGREDLEQYFLRRTGGGP